MKFVHLISISFISAISCHAGYIDSFTKLNIDQIFTPQSAVFVAVGLGVSYYTYDLCRASFALLNGGRGVRRLARKEGKKAIKNNNLSSEDLAAATLMLELFHEEIPMSTERKKQKILKTVGIVEPKKVSELQNTKMKLKEINELFENEFIPLRKTVTHEAKIACRWQIAHDFTRIAIIGAVGYGAYKFINK